MNVDDILVEHGASVRALVDRSVDVDRALAETLGRPVDTVAPAPSPARRTRRLVAVAAVTVVAAVGIGSWLGSRSDPDRLVPTSPETTDLEPAPTTEPSPTTTAPVTDEAVGEVGEVGRFTDGFSVTAAFEALPLRLSKLDGDDSFDRIGIVAADRDAVDDLAPGLELPFPWFPGLDGTATPEQRRSELGFDVTDADRYASMHDWATGYFGIYTGDQVRLGDGFATIGDNLRSLGDGDDFERDVDQISPVRPFGEPIRATTTGETVALSSSTADIEAWQTDGDRLIDDDRLAATAGALDDRGVVETNVYVMDFAAGDTTPTAGDRATITEPFTVLARGTAVGNDELVTVTTYVFDTPNAATAMVDVVDAAWREPSSRTGTAAADAYADVVVDAAGRIVTVTATHGPDTSPDTWIALLATNEALFTYRPVGASVAPPDATAADTFVIANGDGATIGLWDPTGSSTGSISDVRRPASVASSQPASCATRSGCRSPNSSPSAPSPELAC